MLHPVIKSIIDNIDLVEKKVKTHTIQNLKRKKCSS